MNLKKKKNLAVKTFGIGKERIVFVKSRLEEIKEAITKQDMRDLQKEGAILIKEKKGRKKVVRKKRRVGTGKIRKNVKKGKTEYMIITRKLRKYSGELFRRGDLNRNELNNIRKKIRNRIFRSKAHLKEQIKEMRK